MKIEGDPEEWTGTGVFISESGRGQEPVGSSDKEDSCVAGSGCLGNRK